MFTGHVSACLIVKISIDQNWLAHMALFQQGIHRVVCCKGALYSGAENDNGSFILAAMGSVGSRAIGSWMHTHGGSAFVFPSARANVGATLVRGKVVDSYGWNFIDHREADPTQ